MSISTTVSGLVRPSHRLIGQSEYVNTDKLELDLENAEWQNQALRLKFGTLKTDLDRALKQVAARDQAIEQLRRTNRDLKRKLSTAQASRPPIAQPSQFAPVGRLSLNLPMRQIQFDGQAVRLSKSEVQVMAQLFARPGEVIETPELADGMVGNPSLSCIRAYICRVRGKLEAAGAKGYIPVRYGWGAGGFALVDPEREVQP
jgi:hypothetical protein